ncbi:hypothetical protein GPECTOR_45g150 [Gonium pectorale]|uniref:GH18 domain-containing protein n=1 Tax=Gonium pectorale TaxID=33097 RepID=A0A150GAA5_GONPE|nr:hypothetical protein GPECTOR_45g150 [Gonium pectorale]|eukprot:KXZ46280.1 hypothetical protein GPECTOR_45g150 [Gonium pectorale]
MKRPRLTWFALILACFYSHQLSSAAVPVAADSVTGLYIPGWAHNTASSTKYFNTSAVNLTGVSHMYYAFLWIRPNYTVYDPFGNLHLLKGLKSQWPATAFLLSIGGGGFSTALWSAAASTGRAVFVESAVAAMRAAGADGIDRECPPRGPVPWAWRLGSTGRVWGRG